MNKYILYIVIMIVCCSCSNSAYKGEDHEIEKSIINVDSDLVIGSVDQPIENQFGFPVAVRADKEGKIYIADRASMEIKIYHDDGSYFGSLGGRWSGPGEFHEIDLMEWTPDGNLIVMDRGNMQYSEITTDGEEVNSFPYNLDDQFYPQSITYLDGDLFTLFYNSSYADSTPHQERDLFHVYSADFQHRMQSFFPVKELGYEEHFLLAVMGLHPGSFTLMDNNNTLVYSPSTYTGDIHIWQGDQEGKWIPQKVIQATKPNIEPYRIYASESQLDRARDEGVGRLAHGHNAQGSVMGSQFSVDAGLFALGEDRFIHFYAEWKEGHEQLPGSYHPMDLYAQIIDLEGQVTHHSFLFTFIERYSPSDYAVVNWMDHQGNFYMLDNPDGVPVVRRFSLDFK